MKKKKVTLQQVVCAVLSLSKPEGCTCAEISRFCSLRYGIDRDVRAVKSVAEAAVDQGVLVSFKRKYRLAPEKPKFSIHWLEEENKILRARRQRVGNRKGVKTTQKKKEVKRSTTRESKVRTVHLHSSFYDLWCMRKEKTELMNNRRSKIKLKSLCKGKRKSRRRVHESRSKRQSQLRRRRTRSTITGLRRSKRIQIRQHAQVQTMKKNLRSKRDHCRNPGRRQTQNEPDHASKSVRCSPRPSEEFHKNVMRQMKSAVTHAKSWDSLNKSMTKGQRENKELMKDSKLVQKILSNQHGKSWDNLNSRLQQIKGKRSCAQLGDEAVKAKRHKSHHGADH